MAVAFSPDGRILATGLADSTILLWDVGHAIVRPHTHLSETELESLWADLAQNDAHKGQAAVQKLAGAREAVVRFLKPRLQPAAEVPARRVQELIGELDSKEFQKRERAVQELQALTELAEPALRTALNTKPSPEASARIARLVKDPGKVTSPRVLRTIRAIQVLELINSAETTTLLRALASGAPAARETREAHAALLRLASRKR